MAKENIQLHDLYSKSYGLFSDLISQTLSDYENASISNLLRQFESKKSRKQTRKPKQLKWLQSARNEFSSDKPKAVQRRLGDHGRIRILDIGSGEVPNNFIKHLVRNFGPIHLTCIDQKTQVFDNDHWKSWEEELNNGDSVRVNKHAPKRSRQVKILTTPTSVSWGSGPTYSVEPKHSIVELRPGIDVFDIDDADAIRGSFNLILCHAVIHEVHKGSTGKSCVSNLKFDKDPEKHILRFLQEYSNPKCYYNEEVLFSHVDRDGDGEIGFEEIGGRLHFYGVMFERHFEAIENILGLNENDELLEKIRWRSKANRISLLKKLFRKLHFLLDGDGDLLLGDHYFPQYISTSERLSNSRDIRDKVNAHRDDGDFFVDPALVFKCAISPNASRAGHWTDTLYSTSTTWTPINDKSDSQTPWYIEVISPENEKIESQSKDGRRVYLTRLRPTSHKLSVKDLLHDANQAISNAAEFCYLDEFADRFLEAEGSCRAEILQDFLFGNEAGNQVLHKRQGQTSPFGYSMFKALSFEIAIILEKWRESLSLPSVEAMDFWFSYTSLIKGNSRLAAIARPEECPPSNWDILGGSCFRLLMENGRPVFKPKQPSWVSACYNAWLADRTKADRRISQRTLHDWLSKEVPTVPPQTAKLNGLSSRGKHRIQSCTIYPSLDLLGSDLMASELGGEIMCCRGYSEPQHLYSELGKLSDQPNWACNFQDMLYDRGSCADSNSRLNDYVPRVESRERPFTDSLRRKEENKLGKLVYSAFLASVLGVNPEKWKPEWVGRFDAGIESFGDSIVARDFKEAFSGVPNWIEDQYRAFHSSGYLFSKFLTTIPLSSPTIATANLERVLPGSLLLFSSHPLHGALLSLIAQVGTALITRVRGIEETAIEEDLRADAEDRLRANAIAAYHHQISHIIGPKSSFDLYHFSLSKIDLLSPKEIDCRQAQIKFAALLNQAFKEAFHSPSKVLSEWREWVLNDDRTIYFSRLVEETCRELVLPILEVVKERVASHQSQGKKLVVTGIESLCHPTKDAPVPNIGIAKSAIFEMIWNAFKYGKFKEDVARIDVGFVSDSDKITFEVRNLASSEIESSPAGTSHITALVEGIERLGHKKHEFNQMGFQHAKFVSERRGQSWYSGLTLPIQ